MADEDTEETTVPKQHKIAIGDDVTYKVGKGSAKGKVSELTETHAVITTTAGKTVRRVKEQLSKA